MRGWWAGLAPGDRRLACVLVGLIAIALPAYSILGAVLLGSMAPAAPPVIPAPEPGLDELPTPDARGS